MKSINKLQFHIILGGACAALFVLLMMLVILADVQPIGPEESRIGLATLNGAVHDALGYRPIVYLLSELLGYVALLTPVLFALVGFKQLTKRKKLRAVDMDLYVLATVYVLMALAYIFFELCVFNYRPVLIDGELEASFPSSHTMLSIVLLGTAAEQFRCRFRSAKPALVSYVLMAAIVVTRLLSGVHWITDILGGLLLGAALVELYKVLNLLLKSPDYAPPIGLADVPKPKVTAPKLNVNLKKPAAAPTHLAEHEATEDVPRKKKALPKLFNHYEPKH